MGGINIDINQSLSDQSSNDAQSSNDELNFVESSQKSVLPLHSPSPAGERNSTPGVDVHGNGDPLARKPEGVGSAPNQAGGFGDKVQRSDPACFLEIEVKDGPQSNLVKVSSSDLNMYRSGNPSEKSVSNPIVGNLQHGHRGCLEKEHSTKEVNPPQEEDLSLLGTSRTPEELKCTLPRKNLQQDANFETSCFDEIDPSKRKGKDKISVGAECGNFSKRENNSYDSVESTNSKRLASVGKRAACFEMDMNSGCSKRLKTLDDEVYLARPTLGQSGSFFNWMANVTRGIPDGGTLLDRSLKLAHDPLDDCQIAKSLPPNSQEKSKHLDDDRGFDSFVKALYQPGLQNIKASSTSIRDNRQGVDQAMMGPPPYLGDCPRSNREGFKVLQAAPLSSFRKTNCRFVDFPPENVRDSTSSHSLFRGTSQYNSNEHLKEIKGFSSSSSAQNVSLAVPSKSSSSRFSSSGSEFLGSAWITRLCSKSSLKMFSPSYQDNISKRTLSSYERVPYIPNTHRKYEQNFHLSPSKDRNEDTSDQEQTASPSDSCFPEGSYSDQKLKCKLNPIVPSPTMKKLEPITSVFAKRVDALRQIKPSEDLNFENSNPACNFCGTTGHDITICPDITGSEHDDLLKNNRSCDWLQVSRSLCIRCFRLNHWAVACPYASVKSTRPVGNTLGITPLDFEGKWKNQKGSYIDQDVEQGKPSSEGIHCGESSHYRDNDINPMEMRNSVIDIQSSVPEKKNAQRDKVKEGNSHF